MKQRTFLPRLLARLASFAGIGAKVINEVTGDVIEHPGIVPTFGLIVLTNPYAAGSRDQAKALNRAVCSSPPKCLEQGS